MAKITNYFEFSPQKRNSLPLGNSRKSSEVCSCQVYASARGKENNGNALSTGSLYHRRNGQQTFLVINFLLALRFTRVMGA